MLGFLKPLSQARLNIIISGGTGAGKTTLLNVLSGYISDKERIVTIEDSAELQLKQRHVVRLECRPPNPDGKGAVRPVNWSSTACVCGPTASSSAKFAAKKRSTCSRP